MEEKWGFLNVCTKQFHYLVKNPIRVGRSDSADIKCYSTVVSRVHAQVTSKMKELHIMDLEVCARK